MSMKSFLLKKMLTTQMKGVPEEEQNKMMAMIEKNPELFQKIAVEAQEEMKKGKSQMTAIMDTVKKYEEELRSLN